MPVGLVASRGQWPVMQTSPEHYGYRESVIAEDGRKNSALPALIGRLVGIDAFSQAFTNPLLAELVFNKETYSEVGWDIMENTNSLSDLVQRNVPDKGKKYNVTFYND